MNEETMRKVARFINETEHELRTVFDRIEEIEYVNQERVLNAFCSEKVSARHFAQTAGYGYDDIGRDTLDRVFAKSLFCEDALVRPTFASGTHAIFTALAGLLESGDVMLAVSGRPYDTLETAIGLDDNPQPNSLIRNGVIYEQVDLNQDGSFDLNGIETALNRLENVKVVYVQRSRGYAWREAIAPESMKPVFDAVKRIKNDAIIVVDNCYGEFTLETEPSSFGADIIIGSLIKNPGGGIAPTGGYIAGRGDLIERIAARLTVPGTGREIGSYAAGYTQFYQGLFLAPHVTAQALKTAVLFARVFERLKLTTMPASNSVRSDIVQALRFNTAQDLVEFCRAIQAASPVDGYVVPEPWDMPGYNDQVIMAAGTFIQGASIELSADGPIREPYTAYIQGGLTYSHGKIAVSRVIHSMIRNGSIRI